MGFVLIKTYGNYIEDENTLTIINMASGMRLMVHESQVGRATEILQHAEEEFLNSLPCPVCHQKMGFEIKQVTENHAAALKDIPFGGFIRFISRLLNDETTAEVKHYVCNNCHTEFDNLPSTD